MKTQSHTSDHHLLLNTLTKAVLAAMIATSPELLLAAKVTTTPFMTHRPIMHKVTNTRTAASIKKVIPSMQVPATLVTTPSKSLGQHPLPQVKLPTIRSKPINKPSPNRSAALGKVNRTLPANTIGSKAAAIQGAEQARQLGATKGALEGLRNIPGAPKTSSSIMPNTGLGASLFPDKGGRHVIDFNKLPNQKPGGLDGVVSFTPKPTTPRKRPDNAAGDVFGNAPTTAPSSLAGIMGGATGQDAGGSENADHSETIVVDTQRRDMANRDGGHTATTVVHYSDDSSYVDTRTYNNHGFMIAHQQIRTDRNGVMASRISDSLTGYRWSRWEYNFPTPSRNPDPNGGIDDNGAWARWSAKWAGQRPDLDLRTNLNKVNPGPDGTTPNPQAPQLVIPPSILVINPDPETIQGQGITPDARTAKLLRQQLQDKVKGPGFDPSKPVISDGTAGGTGN